MATIGETIRIIKQETLEATKELLVRTAKAEHAAIMRKQPVPQGFTRIVDGRVGAAEESVRADGVIVYQYRRLDEIVQFAMETLFDLSPVLSGEYRRSHVILIDGIAQPDLKSWSQGSEISISNPLPYSRKIEVGKMTMRVPGTSKVYQQAQRIVAGRFGNVVTVRFTYRSMLGNVERQIRAATAKAREQERASLRFPALVIRER